MNAFFRQGMHLFTHHISLLLHHWGSMVPRGPSCPRRSCVIPSCPPLSGPTSCSEGLCAQRCAGTVCSEGLCCHVGTVFCCCCERFCFLMFCNDVLRLFRGFRHYLAWMFMMTSLFHFSRLFGRFLKRTAGWRICSFLEMSLLRNCHCD